MTATVTSSSSSLPPGNGSGGGGDAPDVPGDYKMTVTNKGVVVATFTGEQLSRVAGRNGRGPGPNLADVLREAKVDDPTLHLTIDGFEGDHIELPAHEALDEPGSCTIFITRRDTAKLSCPEGTVRHVSTVAAS